jgi:hypothetical protein
MVLLQRTESRGRRISDWSKKIQEQLWSELILIVLNLHLLHPYLDLACFRLKAGVLSPAPLALPILKTMMFLLLISRVCE